MIDMTTDEEILANAEKIESEIIRERKYGEICSPLWQSEYTIRLWRMAENATETRYLIIAKREMDLFAIEAVKRKLEAIDEAVAEARASERETWFGTITETEWNLLRTHETDTDKFTAGTARNICRLMNEARADERRKCNVQKSKNFWKEAHRPEIERDKKEAYAKGKADTEKRLTSHLELKALEKAYRQGQAELIEKIRADTKKYAKDTVWINDTMTLFDMLGIVDEDASESASEKKGDKR